MHFEETSIADRHRLIPTVRAHSEKRISASNGAEKPSTNIRLCLFLIYYFTLCDTILKFLPTQAGIVLRYLPEAVLYALVLVLLMKKRRIVSFPLFWPLCACALTMTISGILNSCSILWVIGDFRSYYRFTAFTYIAWRTTVNSQRIEQFIKGFLGLTIVEMVVGGIEIIGGNSARAFFSPALGWNSGTPLATDRTLTDAGTWIFGTLSDYNQFGLFMTLSCILALTLYFMKGSGKHLWMAIACALAVVLSFSRHSLLLLALAVSCLFFLQRKKIPTASLVRGFFAVLVIGFALIGFGKVFFAAYGGRLATAFSTDTLEGDPNANIRLYMTVELVPRFLTTYPFFGQGPLAPSDRIPVGETDRSLGPSLKAAPNLPGEVTFFFEDIVWVVVLGLYGCIGLAAFWYVLWFIAAAANRIRKKELGTEESLLAQACLASVFVFMVSGFFSLEMISRDCIPVFWVLVGMVFSLASKSTLDISTIENQTGVPLVVRP